MVRGRAGLLGDRRRGDDAGEGRRDARDSTSPIQTERRWIEPALLALLGRRVRASAPSSSSAPGGRSSSASPRPRPSCMVFEDLHFADSRPARLRRPPARVEPERPDLRRHPGAARAAREATGLGRRQAQLHLALPRAALRRRRCASCWPGSCRACPSRPSRRSSRAPTASRSTRSRPSGCSWPRAGSRSRTAPTARSATSTSLAVPETLDRAHRLAARRPRRRTIGRSCPTRRCSARASRSPACRPCRASTRRELEPRLARPRPARVCSPSRPTRARPERGQYAFVQALIREVAYNTLAQARPQDRATSAAARFFESLGSDELAGAPGRSLPGRPRQLARGARGATRSPPRRGSPCAGPPSGRRRSARTSRRSRSSSRR